MRTARSRRPPRLAADGLLAAIAGGLALVVGHPIPTCWTGVGPGDEAAIDRCVTAFMSRLSPLDRLGYEHPWLAAGLLAAIMFAALAVVFEVSLRLTSGHSAGG